LVEVYDNTDPLLPVLLGTVPTDDFGSYAFLALPGEYALYASTMKPRGGTNVADVNLVVAHLLGNPLTGLQFLAADVNDDGLISVGDYNFLVSELLGSNPVWAAPDWLFENPAFTLTGDLVVDFQGLSSGDPDGSYAVPFGSFAPLGATCADANPIGEVTDLPFDTGTATASGVNPGCGGGTNPIDLWYAYSPSITGTATIDLCGSTFDTRVAVYDACGGAVLACNDDSCGLQSSVTIPVTVGNTYYIQVGGYNAAAGSGDLTIVVVP
jgi:hypothetical protein